tara:strand:- start:119 stop:298 length:180 start_codon:yes stop_codon:yes gene_type:complete
MDWELENENYKLQDMIIIYETEIEELKKEKKELKKEVLFLRAQLEYKSLGNHETLNDEN